MPMGYGTNIDALRAVRLSGATSTKLGDSFAQLSSGMRINRTSVDPAGQSVAQTLNVNSRVLGRARLNIDDGISQLSTADGTYQSASELLMRMQELAEQSVSGALSSAQRRSLDSEFDQLKSEIQRLQVGTIFNGNKVLQGGPSQKSAEIIGGSVGSSPALSSDGRILTYMDPLGRLRQRDLISGSDQTITSDVGQFSVDATGTTIAFINSNQELKTYNRNTGVTQTWTATGDLNNVTFLDISDDGSTVALVNEYVFESGGAAYQTGDGSFHLVTLKVASGQLHGDDFQQGFRDPEAFALSADGSRLAISGFMEIGYSDIDTFVYDTTDMVTYRYLLGGNVQATAAGFDASNRLLALTTSNLNGVNSSGKANILRKNSEADSTSSIENLTRITTGSGIASLYVTDSGNSFTFLTDANPLGTNTTGRQQFFKQTSAGELRQITNTAASLSSVTAVSADGFTAMYVGAGSNLYAVDARPVYSTTVSTGTGSRGIISTDAMSLDGAIRGLNELDIASVYGGRYSLDSIRNSLNQLNLARASVGAGISRLSAARGVTESAYTQTDTAKHRITDVDIADNLATTTRLDILRTTQAAVLAQASRLVPQIALSLLQ